MPDSSGDHGIGFELNVCIAPELHFQHQPEPPTLLGQSLETIRIRTDDSSTSRALNRAESAYSPTPRTALL